MFTLIKNIQKNVDKKLTTFFENKTLLVDEFFPISFSADLSDIFGAALFNSHYEKKNDQNHEKIEFK